MKNKEEKKANNKVRQSPFCQQSLTCYLECYQCGGIRTGWEWEADRQPLLNTDWRISTSSQGPLPLPHIKKGPAPESRRLVGTGKGDAACAAHFSGRVTWRFPGPPEQMMERCRGRRAGSSPLSTFLSSSLSRLLPLYEARIKEAGFVSICLESLFTWLLFSKDLNIMNIL